MHSAAGSLFFSGPEQVGNKGSFLEDGRTFFFLFFNKLPPKSAPFQPSLVLSSFAPSSSASSSGEEREPLAASGLRCLLHGDSEEGQQGAVRC